MAQALRFKTASVLCVLLAAFLCVCFVTPTRAYARYTDASTQYPAARDLIETASEGLSSIGETIYADALSASDIVSGTYIVPAYTSSRMCNFYASREEATAKTNPNRAVINVSGGVITATFYLSGAYTAVYFGPAEQAAAIAPADGMTPSGSYILDGNLDYSSGHGPFTVQLGALNTEFVFSVFNGGSMGVESALWYTRTGAFIATGSFAETYSMAAPIKPKDDIPDNPYPGGAGDGDRDSSEVATPVPEQSSAATNYGANADTSLPQGKRIVFVSAPDEGDGGQSAFLEGMTLTLDGLTTEQIALIIGASVATLGALLFFIRFHLQLRTPESNQDSCGS